MISKNQIKFVCSLQLKKNRDFNNCFVVEGEKIVDEIIQSDFSIYQIFDCLQTPNPNNLENPVFFQNLLL